MALFCPGLLTVTRGSSQIGLVSDFLAKALGHAYWERFQLFWLLNFDIHTAAICLQLLRNIPPGREKSVSFWVGQTKEMVSL
jgi:hypothetical protein